MVAAEVYLHFLVTLSILSSKQPISLQAITIISDLDSLASHCGIDEF